MSPLIIILVLVLALVLYVISVYNSLQQLKTQIEASIQEIGNQLKRQASLIPNLQVSVKGFLKQEKEIFQMLTDARTNVDKASKSGSASDISSAIDSIQSVIPRINVAVEDNPEIKSDLTVGKFMDELRDTADKLMYARRSIIDLSQAFNEKLVTFPSNMVATVFGFKPEKGLSTPTSGEHISVSQVETSDVKIEL